MTIWLAALLLPSEAVPATPPAHGLWLGPIELCRDSVAAAGIGTDAYTGQANVTLRLTAASRARLAALTRSLIGRPLPLWLDGELVTAPTVLEEIRGGEIALSAAERGPALVAAARGVCHAPAPR